MNWTHDRYFEVRSFLVENDVAPTNIFFQEVSYDNLPEDFQNLKENLIDTNILLSMTSVSDVLYLYGDLYAHYTSVTTTLKQMCRQRRIIARRQMMMVRLDSGDPAPYPVSYRGRLCPSQIENPMSIPNDWCTERCINQFSEIGEDSQMSQSQMFPLDDYEMASSRRKQTLACVK